jgi:hypothetical protein
MGTVPASRRGLNVMKQNLIERLGVRRERKLPQRDHQPVEVGGDDQSRLAARQRLHRAVLVGQYNPARAGADRDARAGRAIDAINIGRSSDVAHRGRRNLVWINVTKSDGGMDRAPPN